MQRDLDQLWYTWSKNGLDAMAMGYRVRAASGELRNTQSMRYRILDRFLRYEPPQGVNINDFDARVAPISYAFISNGPEHLLIRKVFKGRDLAGRNSVFFTHLLAGLPDEFTARDAIRLWDCGEIWVESEDGKAANDTQLEALPYRTLKHYADHPQQAQTLPFTAVRARLEDLLLAILAQNGLTQKVNLVGRSNLAAALIYGLTHCLPMTMLGGNFTFSTYESNPHEVEATFMTTVMGTELTNQTYLDVQVSGLAANPLADLQKYKNYVSVAVHYLVSGSADTFLAFLKRMEAHDCRNSEQLLEEFNLAFNQGPLTIKQVETILTHADEHPERLRDPFFQQRSATLLIEQQEQWRKQSSKVVQQVMARLAAAPNTPPHQALAAYFQGTAQAIVPVLLEGLRKVKAPETPGQDVWQLPSHCGDLLIALVPPAANEQFWLKLLYDCAQEPLYSLIKSDPLWEFQLWLLTLAGRLPPSPLLLTQIRPWLDIPSWEKLEKFLNLQVPDAWATLAIQGRLLNVPASALAVVQKYEALFIAALQQLLQQGGQANTDLACSFFRQLVENGYARRVPFLLALVNTYYETGFVQNIFAAVAPAATRRLDTQELATALTGCRPEVIETCNRSQALAQCLQEFMLTLTPGRLSPGKTGQVLQQLSQMSQGQGLPPLMSAEVTNLVEHWLIVQAFLSTPAADRHLLAKTRTAIEHIFRTAGNIHGRAIAQAFADDFVPILVNQVSSEAGLDTLLDYFGVSLTGSRWLLLQWMGRIAGTNKTHLHELLPYAICGIREAERAGQTQDTLNTYLKLLFSKQEKDDLKKIDLAMNHALWPATISQKWDAWRESGKKGLSLANPFAKNNTGRLANPQALVLPGPTNSAFTPVARQTPEQSAPAPVAPRPAAQPQALAVLPAPYRSISYEEYSYISPIMPYLLTYWLRMKLPPANTKDLSKSRRAEIGILDQMRKELTDFSTHPSLTLVTYLADDVLLEEVLKSKLTAGSVLAKSIEPDQYIKIEFESFMTFQGPIGDDTPYKMGLRPLIRRYMVLHHIDQQKNSLKEVFGKNGLQAFLDKEHEKIHFFINAKK